MLIRSVNFSKLSSILQLIFFCVKLSDAAVKTATSLQPTASADSKPFKFGVNKLKLTSVSFESWANSSSLCAICGTHFAETHEPTSIFLRPVLTKSKIRFLRSLSVSGVFSFCRPSRGPTSTILTNSFVLRSLMPLPP